MTDSEEKKVPYLPLEIFEHILDYVDGKTLSSAEQVCKKWNRLCKLKKAKNWWKICCQKEIRKNALNDILNKIYPSHFVATDSDYVDWRAIYRHWHQWSQIHNYAFLKHVVKQRHIQVWNVMKTSGDCVFLSSDHCVFVYNVVEDSGIHEVYHSALHIIDIDLKVDVNFDSTSVNPKEYFMYRKTKKKFAIQHKYLIVNVTESQSMEIDLLTNKLTMRDYAQRCWEGKTARVFSAQGYMKMCVFDDKTCKVITDYSEVLQNRLSVEILDCYDNMVLLRSSKDVYVINIDTKLMTYVKVSMELNIKYYWYCSVLVGFKKDYSGDFWILVNDKKKVFSPFEEIDTRASSMFFYNNNFFLGTATGYLYVYEVTDIIGLLSLDLRVYKAKYKCGDDTITGIQVIDTTEYPCVVVLLSNTVVLIKLFNM